MTRTHLADGAATAAAGATVLPRLVWPLAAATVLANIAWILADGTGRDLLTVTGVVLFFTASLSHALVTRGSAWSLRFFAIALTFGWAIEAVGTTTGVPFGAYEYTDRLGGTLGPVPWVVPLAWAMMAYPCYAVVGRLGLSPVPRVALSAALLASWDLFLDPQMVAEGHWVWADPQPHLPGIPGIPVSNFAGWVVAATLLMTLLTWLVPATDTDQDIAQPLALLMWVYAGNITANAVFLGRPAVALVGGLIMAVPVAIVLAGLRHRHA